MGVKHLLSSSCCWHFREAVVTALKRPLLFLMTYSSNTRQLKSKARFSLHKAVNFTWSTFLCIICLVMFLLVLGSKVVNLRGFWGFPAAHDFMLHISECWTHNRKQHTQSTEIITPVSDSVVFVFGNSSVGCLNKAHDAAQRHFLISV